MNEGNKTNPNFDNNDLGYVSADDKTSETRATKKQFRRRVRSDKPDLNESLTDDFFTDDNDLNTVPVEQTDKVNSLKDVPIFQTNIENSAGTAPIEQVDNENSLDNMPIFQTDIENSRSTAPIEQVDDENSKNDVSILPANEQQERELQSQKFKKITLVLFAVGTVTSLCLVFFFYTLFSVKSSRDIPKIFDTQQLGGTDSSVLISWGSSGPADGYRIRLDNKDGTEIVSDCNLPFAVLRNLQPNMEYSVDISALRDGSEYGTQNITCSTDSYCEVTSVKATKVGSNFVNVSWEYEGVNHGFEAVAYALDSNGKRHLTSKKIEISADSETQCKISGLAAELNYTVVVMPLTSYCKVGKSTFKTSEYSEGYDKLNIIRFVICSANVKNAIQLQDLNRIRPSSKYKTSLIINGKTDRDHKVDISLLITDTKGNLVSEEQCGEIYTNPDGKDWFYHRSYFFDFTTPDKLGDYHMYLIINGKSVYRSKFTVEH